MTLEDHHTERKLLRLVTGTKPDWDDVARACVGLANAAGGRLLLGVEDGAEDPPRNQVVPAELPDRLRKRIGELTVNVQAFPSVEVASTGGQYIKLTILRSATVASTTDGRFYIRVADECRPVVGDDVLRLANERPSYAWEFVLTKVTVSSADPTARTTLVAGLRASNRVKAVVKEKSDDELLGHYGLVHDGVLTRLGVLLVGRTSDRRALGSAPLVQAVRFDDRAQKINKWTWDDGSRSPIELVDDIWRTVPDFRES